jgi:glutamyl-tRNA synthetase
MPLLRNADKSKISKRKNPTSLIWYRDQGFLPEALLNFLALMGYSHSTGKEIFDLKAMLADFDPTRIATSGPVFDLEKLKWLNGEWIRGLSEDALSARIVDHWLHRRTAVQEADASNAVLSWMARHGNADLATTFPALVRRTTPLVRERIRTLEEYAPLAACFFCETLPDYPAADLLPKKRTLDETRTALGLARDRLAGLATWKASDLEAALRALADATGWKPGDLFTPIRTAVTGAKVSPPLFETLEILGKDLALARLDKALALAGSPTP